MWFEDADRTAEGLHESEIAKEGREVGDEEGKWDFKNGGEGGGWIGIGLEESLEVGDLF